MFDDVEALVDLAAKVFAMKVPAQEDGSASSRLAASVFAGPKPATKVFQTEGPSGIRKVVVPQLGGIPSNSRSRSGRPHSNVTSRQIGQRVRSRPESSPEPFETATRDPGVVDGVLRIAVSKVILDEPQIVAAIGKVEAA